MILSNLKTICKAKASVHCKHEKELRRQIKLKY